MDAADLSEDDMEPEDLEKGEDEGEEGEAAGAEGSGQPAVLSITAAPDGYYAFHHCLLPHTQQNTHLPAQVLRMHSPASAYGCVASHRKGTFSQ